MSDATLQNGLDFVAARALVIREPVAWFVLSPGDRPLVAESDEVVAGTAIAYRHRQTRVEAIRRPEGALRAMPEPGGWWPGTHAVRGRVGG